MQRNRIRDAFTVLELLVVIAIIGVMVALLLPAVQSVREAARLTQCRNHLKQLSLAVHLHEDQYNLFPDGGLNWRSPRSMRNGVPNITPDQNWGWMCQILPFIEQGAIYSEQSDKVVQEFTIPTFFCPTRRSGATNELKGIQRGLNDYAANGGIQTRSWAFWGNGVTGGFMARREHSPPATPATIQDGLANSIMLGEKSVRYEFYHQASCADIEGWTAGWDWDSIRWGNQSPKYDQQADNCMPWFGSGHQSGCLFAFGDGSVHTITYSVDGELFRSLCHVSDGGVVLTP